MSSAQDGCGHLVITVFPLAAESASLLLYSHLSSHPHERRHAPRLSLSSVPELSLIDCHHHHLCAQESLLFLSLSLHAFFLPGQWEHTHRRVGDSPGPHTEPPDPGQAWREGAHQCESQAGRLRVGSCPRGCGALWGLRQAHLRH